MSRPLEVRSGVGPVRSTFRDNTRPGLRTVTRLPLAAGVALAAVVSTGCGAEPGPATGTSSSAASAPSAAPAQSSTGPAAAPAGTVVRFSYVGGQVADAVGRVAVPLGSTITLEVTSDTTDEVHLHGYDVSVPVAPGAPASLTFTADIPGVFEVELEEAGVPLTQLEVS